SFQYGEVDDRGDQTVLFSALYMHSNHDLLSPDDTASLKIDGVVYPMVAFLGASSGLWSGYAVFDADVPHEFEFVYNDQVKAETIMKLPSVPEAQFPTAFDPTEEAYFSWQLSSNSQYQFAGADAYNFYTEDTAGHSVNLNPSVRSITIPANAITDLGMGTEYTLSINQMNYKRVGRISFTGYAMASANYGATGPDGSLTRIVGSGFAQTYGTR
ncbi:MAG: hypothetical protein V3576_07585, partial [Candidatus Cloacimonadota bacterium]